VVGWKQTHCCTACNADALERAVRANGPIPADYRPRAVTTSPRPDPSIPLSGGSMALTRMQVLDHVENAFAAGPITTAQLQAAAERNGAHLDILVLLRELPPRRFATPRDIWPYLPDLPVGG
jgi:hypothetical protein